MTLAEPGALVGFLGPRVYEGLYGHEFPAGVQVSENLRSHGLIDLVVDVDGLGATVSRIVGLLARRESESDTRPTPNEGSQGSAPAAWDVVTASRAVDRPGVGDLLKRSTAESIELAGGGEADSRSGIILALASFGGQTAVVVGQDRNRQVPGALIGPADLRLARRGMRLAQGLGLPLVTVIDTPGADLSADAEEGGLAGEIAHCIAELSALTVPTISVLLGQGAGGAALALFPGRPGDRDGELLALPVAARGCQPDRVPRHRSRTGSAAQQGIRAIDLHASGIVDVVLGESTTEAVDFLPDLGARPHPRARDTEDARHRRTPPAPRRPPTPNR